MAWSEVLHGALWVCLIFAATRGGPGNLYALGSRLLEQRRARSALWIGRLLVAVPVPLYSVRGLLLLTYSFQALGRADRAARAASRFLKFLGTNPEECLWHWVNSIRRSNTPTSG